ncbi:1910_t:CDS:2 [Cetraspora pellucida]|uniref:1910_t:CDS:1 n=1 Tax=Cetraspora pellucida TaxID=1433469 RepID=A0A9N9EMR2_9GLOM|nr:1910_t:CDS:2 [Cetraspora pellucida]
MKLKTQVENKVKLSIPLFDFDKADVNAIKEYADNKLFDFFQFSNTPVAGIVACLFTLSIINVGWLKDGSKKIEAVLPSHTGKRKISESGAIFDLMVKFSKSVSYVPEYVVQFSGENISILNEFLSDDFIRQSSIKEYDSDDSIDRLSITDFDEHLHENAAYDKNPTFTAIWLDGEREYRKLFYPWMKGRSPPINVMLKVLPNSADELKDLLNELKSYYKNAKASDPINFYGITYISDLESYMVVIEYFEYGDLRDYLKTNFIELEWKSKLYLLDSIARDICNSNIDELNDEDLDIRKAFEAADKYIPDIATNAYTNVHPKTTWKSQFLKLPKFPRK